MTLLNKAKRPPADTTRRRPLRAILATLLLAPLLMLATPATPAAAQETVTCYLLSDGTDNELSADALYRVDDVFGTPSVVSVGATGTNNAEAFAIRPGFGGYAWDDTDGLVTVDLTDGTTADAAFDIAGAKVAGLVETQHTPQASLDLKEQIVGINAEIATLEESGGDTTALTENAGELRLEELKAVEWKPLWMKPAAFAGGVLLIFLLLFRKKRKMLWERLFLFRVVWVRLLNTRIWLLI